MWYYLRAVPVAADAPALGTREPLEVAQVVLLPLVRSHAHRAVHQQHKVNANGAQVCNAQ